MENETKNKKKTTSTANNKTSKKTTTTTKKKASVKKNTSATNKKVGVKKNSVVENMKAVKTTTQKEVTPVKVEKKETTKKVEEKVQPKVYSQKETKPDVKMFLDSEIGSLLKIVLIIAGVVLIFLLITNIINSYRDTGDDLVTSGDIQYDEILVSNILNQSNSSYYVLVYDAEDLYYETYDLYLTSYKAQDNAIRVYTSVLSNGFNKKYYTEEESNIIGSSLENLKFKGTALVRVENGSIVSAYENPDAIIEHLKSIQD